MSKGRWMDGRTNYYSPPGLMLGDKYGTYEVSIGQLFLQKEILKVSSIHGHGSHLGHVTQLICINFHSSSPIRFHMEFGFK